MSKDTTHCDVRYDRSAVPNFPLLSEMYVEPGTQEDWAALHHLHYKSEGRPFGPAYYRLVLDGQTIGVTVLTMPKGLLKERHAMIPQIKPGRDSKVANTARYRMINANIRVIGRIVLDTLYRGIGASYRFQNLVARQSGFRFIEIQSAMSKYNLLCRARRLPVRQADALQQIRGRHPLLPRDLRKPPGRHAGASGGDRAAAPRGGPARLNATRKFYYAHSAQEKTGKNREGGWERVQAMEPGELIRNLQQLVLGSPLYGVYNNPDAGRIDLPRRLPLTAFDRQKPEEPLVLP